MAIFVLYLQSELYCEVWVAYFNSHSLHLFPLSFSQQEHVLCSLPEHRHVTAVISIWTLLNEHQINSHLSLNTKIHFTAFSSSAV